MSSILYSPDARYSTASSSAQERSGNVQENVEIAYNHFPEERRFVAMVKSAEDGVEEEGGHLEYFIQGNHIHFTHTVTEPRFRGRGIASGSVSFCPVEWMDGRMHGCVPSQLSPTHHHFFFLLLMLSCCRLVKQGVVYAEANKLAVVPECSYVSQTWIPRNKDKHPNLVVIESSRL